MSCCGGNCSECAGCGRALELTKAEINFLQELGAVAFLPVARLTGEDTPVFPENPAESLSLVLRCLEKKGLISLDYHRPLKGCQSSAYASYPIQGSMALTERGQRVLELMEIQGVE